jgi:hypothetical protein
MQFHEILYECHDTENYHTHTHTHLKFPIIDVTNITVTQTSRTWATPVPFNVGCETSNYVYVSFKRAAV